MDAKRALHDDRCDIYDPSQHNMLKVEYNVEIKLGVLSGISKNGLFLAHGRVKQTPWIQYETKFGALLEWKGVDRTDSAGENGNFCALYQQEAQAMPIRARSAACVSWLDLKMIEVQSEAGSEANTESPSQTLATMAIVCRDLNCINLFDYA
ncbi:hypothetical protein BDV09DRAFT_174960 [Aspergillus tetrazonus]